MRAKEGWSGLVEAYHSLGICPADHIAKFTIWQTDAAVWPVESSNPQNVDYGSTLFIICLEVEVLCV